MKSKNLLVTIVFLGVIFFSVNVAMAKVQGLCAECHTMHHSQTPWGWTDAGSVFHAWPGGQGDAPMGALLVDDCCGCHTAPSGTQNDGTGNIPYVDQTDLPTYGATGTAGANTLAGGTFYYVRNGADAKGHNVACLSGVDGNLALEPPGYDTVLGGSLGLPAGAWPNQLTCAGTLGCHGDHSESDPFGAVRGGHHGDDTPPLDGLTVTTSYRFLLGIVGLECNTAAHHWEYQPTPAIHNQYKGLDRATDNYAGSEDTINYLCAECHGFFHSATNNAGNLATGGTAGTAAFTSPWVRHPTDFDMSNASTGEYAAYNGAGNAYSLIAPLASEVVTVPLAAITFGGTDAIVSCISCHRAHGTDWADLLRWDYATMDAGQAVTPNDGCFICHTTK